MESIAFKEEEKEGGGRKQVKGKTASLSHILFFSSTKGGGEARQQAAARSSTTIYRPEKKYPRSNHSERKSNFSSFFDPPPKWERMWQPDGINEGVRGYKISCTKCAGLENMPGNAAFSPALGAIATAADHARHTGSTQASKSLDWCSLLDPNNLALSPHEWAACYCSLSFSRAFCLSILKSPHLQPDPGQHRRPCFSVLSRSGQSPARIWAGRESCP